MPESGTFSQVRGSLPHAYFLHTPVLLMPSRLHRLSLTINAARLLRSDGERETPGPRLRCQSNAPGEPKDSRSPPTGLKVPMDTLSGYSHRPFAFVLRYLRQRLASHLVIVLAVVAAVASSVGTQYGIK